MAAPRKPCPYATPEEFTLAVADAGGVYPLSRTVGADVKTIHRWAGEMGLDLAARKTIASDRISALGKIAALLERSGIDPNDIGKVQQVKLSEWQGMSKDADGEVVVTPLEGTSIVLTPTWETGPAWPVVQPAPPVRITATKVRAKKDTTWKHAVILPDCQIGYRRDISTDVLDPFHDERALDVALQVISHTQPDVIVNLGDTLDLAEFGRWEQEPGFALTTQPSIDRAGRLLAEQRATSPNAEIVFMPGNHEDRLPRSIIANAKAAFGLRKSNADPAEWPVLSVPNLLRMDELGIRYVQGYPGGIYWVNDRLACVHGAKVRSSGSTAAAVIDDERVSIIFAHIHRVEEQHKTSRVRFGDGTIGKSRLAACPGCLCRTDGTVPGTRSTIDLMGRTVTSANNWQQGIGYVTYRDGDSPFRYESIPIHDGVAIFDDREFVGLQ